MSSEVKLKILSVVSLNHFMVREVDTEMAHKYDLLEHMMHRKYNDSDDTKGDEDIEEGSLVAVYVSVGLNPRAGPKRWLRAVVRNVFLSVGSFLYSVYLLDYGLEKCLNRPHVRPLRPHFTEEFVSFQVWNFYLNGLDQTSVEQTSDVSIKMLNKVLKAHDSLVMATVRDRQSDKRSLWGRMKLSDGSDLTQFLLNRRSVDEFIDNTNVRKPKSLPFVKSPKADGSSSRLSNASDGMKSIASNNSIDSIGSVELPIDLKDNSDDSVVVESDDSSLEIRNSDLSDDVVNGMNGVNGMSGHKRVLNKRLNLIKQMKDKRKTEENEVKETVASEDYFEFVAANAKRPEDNFEWPEVKTERPYGALKPAGVLPPPHVLERIYTLRRNQMMDHF